MFTGELWSSNISWLRRQYFFFNFLQTLLEYELLSFSFWSDFRFSDHLCSCSDIKTIEQEILRTFWKTHQLSILCQNWCQTFWRICAIPWHQKPTVSMDNKYLKIRLFAIFKRNCQFRITVALVGETLTSLNHYAMISLSSGESLFCDKDKVTFKNKLCIILAQGIEPVSPDNLFCLYAHG